MERRLTERGEQRRTQLVEFATRRFAENGYHPTSVAEIVEGIGVGKGVFYWYFPSKEQLFREILRDAQRDLRKRQQQAIEGLDLPIDRIEQGIRESMRWSAENRHLFVLFQFATSEERFAPAMRKGEEVAVADAARHVKDAMADGEIPDGDPMLQAHAMLGVASHLARVFIHEQGRSGDEIADAAVEFCLRGILGGA